MIPIVNSTGNWKYLCEMNPEAQITHSYTRVFLCFLAAFVAISLQAQAQNGDLEKRRAFFRPENRAQKIQTAEEAFPRRLVHAANSIWKLERVPLAKPFAPTYLWKGETNTLDHFLEHNVASAFLVLKDDRIVFEKYLLGSSNSTRFFSFSSAKSITSTLVGMALEDGYIKRLDDTLTQYLPALIGTAYETVTIKDSLQMLTGVHDQEPDEEWSDRSISFVKCHQDSIVEQRYRFVEGAHEQRRECSPGVKFNYSTLNTAILGWLVETVTKKRLATYMEERLWQPAGMESDAAWLLDGPPEIGREMAGGNFTATLKDFGRFGLLALHEGKANGRQLISRQWFKAATTPDRAAVQYGKLSPDSQLGYGYQWWLRPNGNFLAEGVFGQFISIYPKANVVIVKLGAWPKMWVDDLELECYALFDAIAKSLEEKP